MVYDLEDHVFSHPGMELGEFWGRMGGGGCVSGASRVGGGCAGRDGYG